SISRVRRLLSTPLFSSEGLCSSEDLRGPSTGISVKPRTALGHLYRAEGHRGPRSSITSEQADAPMNLMHDEGLRNKGIP
ncbi:hypothetical protein PRIPAC_76689, partial [Pristionchus pacificus]